MRKCLLLLISLTLPFFFIACGDDGGGEPTDPGTEDGVEKETAGKGDAWDWRNDPARFRMEFVYNFEELPTEGASEKIAWADTYWPTYRDNANWRWKGDDELSPAEKYDRAFNDWEPPQGFMDLKPYDPDSCEWDDAYYEQLGPAALDLARDGNWRSHNGIDDDGDGVEDADECGWGEDKDLDGVEKWWGKCHAWVPAAILEDEPLNPVTRNGVTFEVADIKALLVEKYDRSNSYMLGGRCNAAEVDRDDSGRIPDSGCRDVNAGAFHIVMTNLLGIQKRPFAEDRVYDYEVWNQPVVGFEITEQKEITLAEVQELLNTGPGPDEDDLPETQDEKDAVLRVANEVSETDLAEAVGLRDEEVAAIVEARGEADFDDYGALEELVGARAVSRMLDYAREQEWAPEPEPAIYSYNEEAERFIEVRVTLDYITESDASTEPTSDVIDRYTRTDRYHYLLELDGNGDVIGGEWMGSSIPAHPDFLWLPTGPGGGTSNVDLAVVRDLVAESREGVEDPGSDEPVSFEKTEEIDIPDNDPEGAVSTLEIDADGNIQGLTIDLNIEHSYRGDLLVQLEKGGVSVVVYDGYDVENRWDDDVVLTGETVEGFEGMPLAGEWTLTVIDSLNQDTGTLLSWGLNARVD